MVLKGFHRLDNDIIKNNPPNIKWGELYKTWEEGRKVEYLEKLCATMNHAARLIQDERNALNELCEHKEGQLVQLAAAMEQNTNMVQQQVTKMNEERQQYNAAYAQLNAELKELRSGAHS